jgi:lactate permease
MVGRQLPIFSLLIPFWIVAAFSGWRSVLGIWPVALTAGLAFAIPQFVVSNFHGPWLVDIVAGASAIVATVLLLRVWQPKEIMRLEPPPPALGSSAEAGAFSEKAERLTKKQILQAWLPWFILTVFILGWGLPQTKVLLDKIASPKFAVPHLDGVIQRMPPVVPANTEPESAVFRLNFLSTTGSGIFVAALFAGFIMGFRPSHLFKIYSQTIWKVRFSLLTIAAMLALGNVTKFSGTDATIGLALVHTGSLYPFFGTLLGWLGVALTGSDTASNVLFGSLQSITSQQLGISPILMGAANSAGGVMGKMVDAQSIVIASTATHWYGHEGTILRYVFWHSLALAILVGALVYLQAYIAPFTHMVVH